MDARTYKIVGFLFIHTAQYKQISLILSTIYRLAQQLHLI